MSPDPNALPDWPGKLEARGKFFFSGADKVLLKGVTYGPFAPDRARLPVPRVGHGDRRATSSCITELGANTLRTFTVAAAAGCSTSPRSRGLRVLVGIPWASTSASSTRRS